MLESKDRANKSQNCAMTTNAVHFYCNSVEVPRRLRDWDHTVIGVVQAHNKLALSIKNEGKRALNCFGHFCLRICSLCSSSPGHTLFSAPNGSATHSPWVAEPEQGQMAFHALAYAMSALCVYVHSFNQAPFAQLVGHMLAILPIPNPVKMFILVKGGLW